MSARRREGDGTVPWSGTADGRLQVHLVGFMGTGKSTVGACLARLLVWNFLDLDNLVERYAGARITELFADRGEAAFREMEAHVLRQAVQKPRTVVALGGGTLLREENRRLVAERAVSVWLDCPLEALLDRVGRSSAERPLWDEPEALAARFRERRDLYARADLRVDAAEDPETVARAILGRLRPMGVSA